MNTPSTFIRYSLRNRMFVLAGATFLLCAVVILLFFPLLNLTLTGLQDRTLNSMREGAEVEATTIARLLVMEFSSHQALLTVTPTSDREVDKWIKDMLWEKVTFNEIIEGIELIQGQPDGLGRHLTYLFYRREAPELKPMAGPQKIMKTFEGLEQDLIKSINEQQRVDNALQESVNRGPKQEGVMLMRYMPVYVLLADAGAVYWGVAKIGIDTSRMRQLLAIQSEEQQRIRNAIWIEITLSLLISGLLAMSLIYVWVRYITEPLRNLSAVAADFQNAGPEEFELWLENLKRVDPQGQAEVVVIQQVLERLGAAVPRLGQRLIDGETQACLGRVLARGLSALKTRLAEVAAPEPGSVAGTSPDAIAGLRSGIPPVLDDVAHFWSDPTGEWAAADMTPGLQRAWRLVSLGLPAGVTPHLNLAPLPPVWGSAAALSLAALYLLDFAVDRLDPAGDLGLAAEPTPAGGVRLTVWLSGDRWSPPECAAWLQPFADPEGIKGGLGPALAAAIAAQHGGSLAVAPQEAGGAAFSLEIPPLDAVREFHEPIV